MATVTSINEVLAGHTVLEVECVDRLYLNAYVPRLQVGGQVATFFTAHRGNPIPSPALMTRIGNRFRRDVNAFAEQQGIPILRLKKPDRSRWDDRKLDHVRPYLEAADRERRFGVVAIVQAQEFQWVFSARNRSSTPGVVSYGFVKEDRRVGVYYFYIWDREFGPGFIKICTYFPYPAKVWLNGHEWAKRQADHRGLAHTALSNGFASCEDPAALQAICDRFGPGDIQGFFHRWMKAIPTPLTPDDRQAGYWWELSMRQVEVSKTLVFDDPRRARGSSRPWSPTTSGWVDLMRWPWSLPGRCAAPPNTLTGPGCSDPAPRSRSSSATSTAVSSSTSRKGERCVSKP